MYLTGVKRRKKSEGGGVIFQISWMIWDGISQYGKNAYHIMNSFEDIGDKYT